MRGSSLALALALLLALLPTQSHGQSEGQLLDLATYQQSELVIVTRQGEQRFAVWLATTWPQQAQGLMYVRELPADRGMLFVHDPPRVAKMWMRNTYIPLDMLFIDSRGRIARIAAMTTPFSLDNLTSVTPVRAVLELKGGEAARRGIRVGDRVVHDAFTRGRAESAPATRRAARGSGL